MLAKRREGDSGTPENLCRGGSINLDISLDEKVSSLVLGDKEADRVEWVSVEGPLLAPKKIERGEQEKREIEVNLEKLADRLQVTLSVACSRKRSAERQTGIEDSLVLLANVVLCM